MTTLEEWRSIFDRFDANKDGQISTSELKSMFDSLGRCHAVLLTLARYAEGHGPCTTFIGTV